MWFIIALFACGDKEESATFTAVENEVIGLSCAFSSCHGASAGAGGLQLTGTDDYQRLVNVQSTVLADETLVIPFDADNSYLIKKVLGTDGIEGDIMSPGSGISEEQLQLLTSWINAGAEDN